MLSQIVAVVALGAVVANAAPAPVPGAQAFGPGSFSVGAIRNPNFQRNGTAAMLKAYRKHGLTPTRQMPREFSNLGPRQDGTEVASPADNVEYLVPVTIGGQTLQLDFDTGSSDLWCFSSSLPASSRSGHNIFNPAQSDSFQTLTGYTWDISYADGSGASGTVGTDVVSVGATTVEDQAVELATKVSSSFVSSANDGLLGLGFDNINTVSPNQQATFFTNAKPSLSSPLFAAYLPYNTDGSYDFGYTDDSKYSGSLTYTSVDSSGGFWEFPSTSFKVGNTVYSDNGQTGIADTGTTLLLASDAAVEQYYSQVDGAEYSSTQGGYIFPCSTDLPTFSFKIGPTAYATIPTDLLNFGTVGGGSCFGGLQSVGSGNQNIYGDVFFQAYYSVFSAPDGETPSFGFATIA